MTATKLSFNALCFAAAEAHGIRIDDPKAIDYAVKVIALYRYCEDVMESIVAVATVAGEPLPLPAFEDMPVPLLVRENLAALRAQT